MAVPTGTIAAVTEIGQRPAPASDLPGPRIAVDTGFPTQRIGPETARQHPQRTHANAPAIAQARSESAIILSRTPEIGAIPGFETLDAGSTALPLPAQGATAPTATFAGTGAAMPQQIAQHIAASLPRPVSDMGNGTLELALDPPELGRVRMSLVETGGVMTLSIVADRPETAELMRRHMDILAQEFSRAGLDAPNVRVGTGWDGSGAAPDRDGPPPAPPDTGPGGETAPAVMHAPMARMRPDDPTRALDLRL